MNVVSRIHQADYESILDKIDLKRLKYFVAVADAGSFSRAADRLRVAQSHLSRQIMRLEADVGHRLFVRRARHVELTDAGTILRQEAELITLQLDSLPERMNEARAGSVGSLCLGLADTECFHPLPATIIKTIAQEEPQFALRFCVEPRASLIEAIVERRVHACFARPPFVPPPEVRLDYLATEPMLVAVHMRHRFAGRDVVALAELAGERFVLCERNSAPETYDQLMMACERVGFTPQVMFHAPQPACALLIASTGMAVALVPASLRTVHSDNLHFISLADDMLDTRLALITRTDEHIAGVRLLRKYALATAALEASAAPARATIANVTQ